MKGILAIMGFIALFLLYNGANIEMVGIILSGVFILSFIVGENDSSNKEK